MARNIINRGYIYPDYYSRYVATRLVFNQKDGKTYYSTPDRFVKNVERYVNYVIKSTDTLDLIALKHYGNPLLWWIIADMNNIIDPFKLEIGATIKIPNISDVRI